MKCYVMIGIPGSGKSTYAKNHINAKIFSSDEYRKKLLGSEDSQENGKLIFDTLYSEIEIEMYIGQNNICFDATNVTPKSRKKILMLCDKYHYIPIAVFVTTSTSESKRRNLLRERNVPDYVIDNFAARIIEPSKKEGFYEIVKV